MDLTFFNLIKVVFLTFYELIVKRAQGALSQLAVLKRPSVKVDGFIIIYGYFRKLQCTSAHIKSPS